MPIDKVTAQQTSKKVNTELFSLNPATIISLFEIDVTDLAFDAGVVNQGDLNTEPNTVFRFHNSLNITNNNIVWRDQEYIAAPIRAEGFEINSRGTLPQPKLSITVNEDGVRYLALLKDRTKQIGDLIGAKVTRTRVFAKHLDAVNFLDDILPEGFEPDSDIEISKDIFFIDRKSNENKSFLEYELASILDVQGIKLPGRIVTSERCVWQYRGEGCLYENASRRVPLIHGEETESDLPVFAPPVATVIDEDIEEIVETNIKDRGDYHNNTNYLKGDSVFIERGGIKYYFVAKIDNPPLAPPNTRFWLKDECSKSIKGCKLRWSNIGDGTLPTSSFPASNRLE